MKNPGDLDLFELQNLTACTTCVLERDNRFNYWKQRRQSLRKLYEEKA
jgi:hypothetical protein